MARPGVTRREPGNEERWQAEATGATGMSFTQLYPEAIELPIFRP